MARRKMSTVATFSRLYGLQLFPSVYLVRSVKEEGRKPFQFKLTVKYDSTGSES